MKVQIIITLFWLIPALSLADSTNYKISFWGLDVADVQMIHQDTSWNNTPAIKIDFTTKTTKFTSKIFKVDNYYSMLVDSGSYQMLSFKKVTHQPGLSNILETQHNSTGLFYNGSKIQIPPDAFNIFTMMDYLQQHKISQSKYFLIEKEGELFDGNVVIKDQNDDIIKYQILFDLQDQQNEPLLEHTDIFTWAIFKPEAIRYIWVDQTQKKIIRCEFKIGLAKLIAEIDDD